MLDMNPESRYSFEETLCSPYMVELVRKCGMRFDAPMGGARVGDPGVVGQKTGTDPKAKKEPLNVNKTKTDKKTEEKTKPGKSLSSSWIELESDPEKNLKSSSGSSESKKHSQGSSDSKNSVAPHDS